VPSGLGGRDAPRNLSMNFSRRAPRRAEEVKNRVSAGWSAIRKGMPTPQNDGRRRYGDFTRRARPLT